MQRAHVKTVLLIIGSAIGGILLFIAAVIGFFVYQSSPPSSIALGSRTFPVEQSVSQPPGIHEAERFYGTHGMYRGDFASERNKVLDAGAAALVGAITVDQKPVPGARLRLALNGSVMSQWGTTGLDGKYTISVPPGKYRIDGYQLDSSTVNKPLKGKIDSPRNPHWSEATMTVAEGKAGRGLTLDYVDPVRKIGPTGEVSKAGPVVISWEPYLNAASYRLQLVEQEDPRDYTNQKYLFDWQHLPTVSETSLDLSQHGISVKKGFHYSVQISALDANNRKLSESPSRSLAPDFVVID